jgi:AraC family transcriptional regulator, arabinose operon regulatory protein
MDIRIQRLISYIQEQPHRPLSLAFMAQVTGLSASRLRHKFKAEVGVTPTVYLQTLRLRKAKELLTTNNLTVKEARAAVGISSDSYFTHQFKRTFGNPPSHFKQFMEESGIPAEQIALVQSETLTSIATLSN